MVDVRVTAKKYGMTVNPNTAHVKKIQSKLKANEGYCPCFPQKNDSTLCPCDYMRYKNVCRCGLYVRSED